MLHTSIFEGKQTLGSREDLGRGSDLVIQDAQRRIKPVCVRINKKHHCPLCGHYVALCQNVSANGIASSQAM